MIPLGFGLTIALYAVAFFWLLRLAKRSSRRELAALQVSAKRLGKRDRERNAAGPKVGPVDDG